MTSKRQLAAQRDEARQMVDQYALAMVQARQQRDSLAFQVWSLRRQVELLENDIAEWRGLASDNYRLYIDAKYTPADGEQQPRLTLLEGGRPRDERGRFTKAAGQ